MNVAQLWHDERDGVLWVAGLTIFAFILLGLKIAERIQLAEFRSYLEDHSWELQPITKKFSIFGRRISDETKELSLRMGSFDSTRQIVILAKKTLHGYTLGTQLDGSLGRGAVAEQMRDYRLVVRIDVPEAESDKKITLLKSLQSAGLNFVTTDDAPMMYCEKEFFVPNNIKNFHKKVMDAVELVIR
jgi:hypothetical protein